MGRLPLIMFQVIISLKAYLRRYSNTHTHTHTHTLACIQKQTNHGIIIPKPSIHLLWHISISQRAKTSQGKSRSTCYSIQTPKSNDSIKHTNHIIFIKQTKCMFIALCMTYLTYLIASQHLYINSCSWCMHVHGIYTI